MDVFGKIKKVGCFLANKYGLKLFVTVLFVAALITAHRFDLWVDSYTKVTTYTTYHNLYQNSLFSVLFLLFSLWGIISLWLNFS